MFQSPPFQPRMSVAANITQFAANALAHHSLAVVATSRSGNDKRSGNDMDT